MDKFNRNALIGLVVMSVVVLVFFAVASALGATDIGGTDAKVEGQAAASGNKVTPDVSTWGYALGEVGENVGFGLAGVFGGFFVGYLWPMIFEEPQVKVEGGQTLG
jgi:ABC-type cobalt transport system substrate-binding protein